MRRVVKTTPEPGAVRIARHTARQTVVHLVTTGLILALIASIAIKLKLFGGH